MMVNKNLLKQIEEKWCAPLMRDHRFFNRDSLLKKFQKSQSAEIVNELIIANLILNNKDFFCQSLQYEPQPGNLKVFEKSADFLFITDKAEVYCDVKTIRPTDKDAWEKYEEDQKYFPSNIELDLEKDWLGGEIYHHMRNSRASMLQYSIEFDSKIESYSKTNKTRFILIFCGNGFHWHMDELEDFADFYFTGSHNPDDHFSKMEDFFILENNITLKRAINRFAYFERKECELDYRKFVCPVRGPWITGRWRMADESS